VNRAVRERLKLALEIILAGAVGILIVRAFDLQRFRLFLGRMTPGAVAGIICFQAALLALAALRWAVLLREAGIYRGVLRVSLARLVGFAIMYLTPAITFAGVPARAVAYRDSAMKDELLYATIGVDSVLEIIGKVPVIAAGLCILLILLHPGTIFAALGGLAVLACLGAVAVMSVRLLGRSPGAAGVNPFPVRLLARIAPRLSRRIAASLLSFRVDFAALVRSGRALPWALSISVLASLLEVGQALFLLGFLGRPSLPFAFVVFASVIVHGVIGVLPGNIGGMEGTHIAVFALLGLGSTEAVFYTILLRVGQMALALVGVLVLLFQRVTRAQRTAATRGVSSRASTASASSLRTAAMSRTTRAGRRRLISNSPMP
jgi:uncharacterized membrane protein YbhN (UPF0104 family)